MSRMSGGGGSPSSPASLLDTSLDLRQLGNCPQCCSVGLLGGLPLGARSLAPFVHPTRREALPQPDQVSRAAVRPPGQPVAGHGRPAAAQLCCRAVSTFAIEDIL